MDGFEQESAGAGSGQNDCSSASKASGDSSAPDGLFMVRADQWRDHALGHPDDRQACIGFVSAGTARLVHASQTAIERGIANCQNPLEVPSIQHAIAAHTGLLRQWHSMMSFETRLEQIRLDAEKLNAERQLDPLLKKAR
jgi:hypothetical protein